MDISDWRKKIDELDEQIVQLISQRAAAAQAIGELKKQSELPSTSPGESRLSSITSAASIPAHFRTLRCCTSTSASST